MLITFISVNASVYSQVTRLDLKVQSTRVKDVLSRIEDQSNFFFMYNDRKVDVERKVDLDLKQANIEAALKMIFKDTNTRYIIKDRQIVLYNEGDDESRISNIQQGSQQRKSVSGKVTDTNGAPLPGVSVVIKGTTNGAITDANGNYLLSKIPENGILQFSFVGMKRQEFSVSGKTVINVSMVDESVGIEEVVAIGYGTTKKSDLTGSVSSLSSKELDNQVITNTSTVLQGRSAGVVVTNLSGAPGASTKIRIRGANSIGGGNDPLFVVDGIQLGGIDDINANDIESMEILKDASATAIYGSRGANGVVIVTTKRGKTGKLKIDFITNLGASQIGHKYDLLDPVTYAQMCNLKVPNSYSDDYINALKTQGGTDWQNEIFQTGKSQDYQLTISGGNDNTKYYVSGRYLNQDGIVLNSNFKKYSITSNVQGNLGKKFTLDSRIILSRTEGFNNQSTGGQNTPIQQSILWGPAEPVYWPGGNYYKEFDNIGGIGKNPVAVLKSAYVKGISNTVMANTKLGCKFFDFLSLDIVAGVDANFSETDQINGEYSIYGNSAAYRGQGNSIGLQNSNILTFHKTFGGTSNKHDLTVTGVYEQGKGTSDGYSIGGGLVYPSLQYYNLQSLTGLSASSSYSMSSLKSWIGRLNYIFNDKYYLTATYRADGSSKFPLHHWGYFPSFGLAWKASEEEFIKNLNLFSSLKLRGGWGVTGNQAVDPYSTIPKLNTGYYGYGLPTTSIIIYDVDNHHGDSNLKWESTNQMDFGVDMGFFNNRLTVAIDYYRKKTKDLLLNEPIPYYDGGLIGSSSNPGYVTRNVGSVNNNGAELMIEATPVNTKNLTWTLNFNIATYKNKVTNLGPDQYISVGSGGGSGIMYHRIIVGQPLGTFYGYKFLGIYQESEAAEAALFGLKPGDSKYLDVNDDHIINSDDQQIIGHANPKYTWGLSNTVKYKNFEFNMFIQAIHGNEVIDIDYGAACSGVVGGINRKITSADVTPWTPENKNNMWPSLTSTSNEEFANSSKWVQDGSFVRIKNLSIAYHLPENLIKGIPVKIMISAQNLLTFTKYKGFDPEASTMLYTGKDLDTGGGVISGAYPCSRTYSFTLQFSL